MDDEEANEKIMTNAMIENICNHLNINAYIPPKEVSNIKSITQDLRIHVRSQTSIVEDIEHFIEQEVNYKKLFGEAKVRFIYKRLLNVLES